MPVSTSDPILIIGGGAFGLSTAVHLLQAGFKDITVLDRGENIPSPYSAANDLNKIVRAEYEDEFYTELSIQAIDAWQTPLFAPHFHQVGFLNCVTPAAPKEAIDTLGRFRAAAQRHSRMAPFVKPINTKKDLEKACWQYKNSPFPGWQGYVNTFDGYANSGAALRSLYEAIRTKGVKFILGSAGHVCEIIYEDSGSRRRASGVRTKDDHFYASNLVIVAAGAAAGTLVPAIGKSLVAKSWSVAHILLTDDETATLRGIPVTYARDLGFFFEPDPKTNLLKLCPMGGGYVNTDPGSGISRAPALSESRFLPQEDEAQLRELLRQTFSSWADRPFVKTSLCWFADTADSNFIIDYVPDTGSSVMLLSGDSGHGFKFFPIFGRFVLDLIFSGAEEQSNSRWKWRSSTRKQEATEDWGGEVSWRLGKTTELADILPASKAKL